MLNDALDFCVVLSVKTSVGSTEYRNGAGVELACVQSPECCHILPTHKAMDKQRLSETQRGHSRSRARCICFLNGNVGPWTDS